MSRATSRILMGLFAGGAACGAAHADRPKIGAFMDLQQVATTALSGEGVDDVTYTEVSGSVAAEISNRRIVASGTYRLSYRIPEYGDSDKNFTQDGVMRLQAKVIDEWLAVDAGAIATRSRVDPSGAAPTTNVGNPKNLTQTYSFFFQPALAHRIGDLSLQFPVLFDREVQPRLDHGETVISLTVAFHGVISLPRAREDTARVRSGAPATCKCRQHRPSLSASRGRDAAAPPPMKGPRTPGRPSAR